MMKAVKLMLVITVILLSGREPAVSQTTDTTVALPALINEALENNPNLQSAMKSWMASKSRIPQAGALPDPIISFRVLNLPTNSLDFNQEAMTGKQIAFSQNIPFPGKLGLKTRIAREGAQMARARFAETRIQLIHQVKNAYYDLYLVDKTIATVKKNISAFQQFVKIAETKYSVGKGLQQDVLRSQVELSKMMDRLIRAQQKRETVAARINALLNRPAGSSVGKPAELAFDSLSTSLDSLKALADKNRPLFEAWRARIRQSQESVHLARKNYWPDFGFTLAYTQREPLLNGGKGYDFLSGIVNLKVPLYFWRKQKRKVEETRSTFRSADDAFRDVRNRVYAKLDQSLSDLGKNARLLELFRTGIIPQASQSLQSALVGYQTDKIDFLTLINNQINLFNFELDYYRILSEYYKTIAALEAETGVQLVPAK